MEIWDIYTKDRVKTGRRGIRGSELDKGEFHLVVFAFILNAQNEILISRRSMNKTFPGCLEITGGSAISGDSSEEAIVREIKEELGIDVSMAHGHLMKTHVYEGSSSFIADTYIFFEDVNIHDVVCQVEEVSEAMYVSISEFQDLLDKEEFTTNLFIYEPLNQVIVECYFYSWLQNDFQRFSDLLHENIIVEECSGDVYEGKLSCEKWFQSWNQAGNAVKEWKINKTIAGDLNKEIVVEWNFVCMYENVTYSFDGCSIFEFEDQKIISLKEYQMDNVKKYPYK